MPTATTTRISTPTADLPATTSGVAVLNGSANAGHVQGDAWLDVVRERLTGLRYGVIQIVVHDGRVTQVECTEKVRFDSGRGREPGRPA
jgi:hypothetical protein